MDIDRLGQVATLLAAIFFGLDSLRSDKSTILFWRGLALLGELMYFFSPEQGMGFLVFMGGVLGSLFSLLFSEPKRNVYLEVTETLAWLWILMRVSV